MIKTRLTSTVSARSTTTTSPSKTSKSTQQAEPLGPESLT